MDLWDVTWELDGLKKMYVLKWRIISLVIPLKAGSFAPATPAYIQHWPGQETWAVAAIVDLLILYWESECK